MKPNSLSGARTLLEQGLPNVPRETIEKLLRYTGLTMTWNPRVNLTGAKDPSTFVEHQVLDCAQAYFALPSSQVFVDLGSGSGLPGIVWAILNPDQRIILVEILKKRSAFLNRTIAELELKNSTVIHGSFLDLRPHLVPEAGNLVSRGTWPPQELLKLAQNTLLPWKRWWVFSNEKLHQQYLKLSPAYTIRADSLKYLKNNQENGLLTRLDRE